MVVRDLNPQGAPGPVVAIIGGGASGALAAIALLNSSVVEQRPVRVVLIDRYGRHALGQAYSTTHPQHLLNSPAEQMSAISGDPKHLIRWAEAAEQDTSGFMPRQVYGRYLRETLSQSAHDAWPLSELKLRTCEVVAIRRDGGRRLDLVTAPGGRIAADVAILATGSLPPELPFPVPASPRIIADPWAPGALRPVPDGSQVLVLGTGLTALDLALSVTGGHPGSTVYAVSRHGLLPRPHREGEPSGAPVRLPAVGGEAAEVEPGQLRLSQLARLVRAVVAAHADDWPLVMDALRPRVPEFWQALPVSDQRLFLTRLARYWEVHRHRVPRATASRIEGLREPGRLILAIGSVTSVAVQGDGLRVEIRSGDSTTVLTPGWLLNGTGQGTHAAATADPLLSQLFATGLARPDPHGLGIDAHRDGAVLDRSGTPSDSIFTLGPPLRGLWYETTAIPEIREQAAALAELITERFITGAAGQPSRAAS
jgi:uncharacterized NAD(P)/FAD-binding protein YdhS